MSIECRLILRRAFNLDIDNKSQSSSDLRKILGLDIGNNLVILLRVDGEKSVAILEEMEECENLNEDQSISTNNLQEHLEINTCQSYRVLDVV